MSQYQCVTDRQRDGRSDDSQYIALHNNVCWRALWKSHRSAGRRIRCGRHHFRHISISGERYGLSSIVLSRTNFKVDYW